MLLEDSAGNFIWVPNSTAGAATAVPNRLIGLPLVISDEAAALGSAGDLILANLGMYGWAVKRRVVFESTLSHHWLADLFSYRAIYRMNGKSILSQRLTDVHGSETLSAFVILD
jgi:HK97 family phage major capsid protein